MLPLQVLNKLFCVQQQIKMINIDLTFWEMLLFVDLAKKISTVRLSVR